MSQAAPQGSNFDPDLFFFITQYAVVKEPDTVRAHPA